MRFFLLSITKIAHGHILFALNAEDREDEYHGEYGEEHAGDGADGEVEPENLLGAVGEERRRPRMVETMVRVIGLICGRLALT